MKTVMIIGGSGAIGKALVPLFDPKEYYVEALSSKVFELPEPAFSTIVDVDIVINLAGVTANSELHLDQALNKRVIDVNCLGAVNILNLFLPSMRQKKYGRIILMSSIFSKINIVGQGVYSASKAFVDKLVKIASLENAKYGVTINSIQLGYMGIGMGIGEDIDAAKNKPALKRFCTINELHNLIMVIINTEYLTGQNIALEGGIR